MPDEPELPDGDGAAERLAKYRAKRSADRTPEPFGGEEASVSPEAAAALPAEPPAGPSWARPRLFCVQKHAATRLHYDFRVEIGGVLRSWAVPRGPSLDPNDKRMAVEVEDHPVEYADFEGEDPRGQLRRGRGHRLGQGLWIPLENPEETLPKGKLTFELRGYKLRGAWHLFRTKGTGKGKAPRRSGCSSSSADGWASATRALPQESIYSGLTLEEIRDAGASGAAEVRAELERLGAPRREVRAGGREAHAGGDGGEGLHRPGLALRAEVRRLPRARRARGRRRPPASTGGAATPPLTYPDVARALARAALRRPRPRRRGGRPRRRGPARASSACSGGRSSDGPPTSSARALEMPATLLRLRPAGASRGFDLRPLPLVERKRLLQRVLPRAGPVRFLDHVAEQGEAFYARGRAGCGSKA